jgi:intraflagellar transport protein 140
MWITQLCDEEYQIAVPHQTFPLLAGCKLDGTVCVLDGNLNVIQSVIIKRDMLPNHLLWHPHKKFLAISWANGSKILIKGH